MLEPMRVLYMIDNLLFGGAQRDLGQMVTALKERGYEQTVICLNRADDEMLEIFAAAEVAVLRSSPLEVATGVMIARARSLIKRKRIELLVTILPVSETFGKFAGKLAGVPVSMSMVLQHKEPWQLWANRIAAPWLDRAIINTDRLRAFSIEREGIPEERLLTINNGVDLREFQSLDRSAARKRLGMDESVWAIGCTGRLSPEKGQDTLVKAFIRLAGEHDRLHLFLAGEGGFRSVLEKLLEGSPLRSRVHLLGNRNDVPSILPAYDIYVQPSVHEGMPNALLEAMAAGLPCVVSDVGGMQDVVLDGETGRRIPAGDDQALAEVLGELLASPSRCRDWGAAGRARVKTEYSLEKMLNSYDALFREAILNARQ